MSVTEDGVVCKTPEAMAGGADISVIVDRVRERLPDILVAYRFGSSGTEAELAGSDLDLAVYAGKPLPAAELWYVAQDLAVLAGRDVDLVDLGTTSTVMRAQVISTGERLWCSDELACEAFEDFVYSSYARLQEERRGILEDALKRGSVYGR